MTFDSNEIEADVTRALWIEHGHRPSRQRQIIRSTITKVYRRDDGFVTGVYARSETGDFGRTFTRHFDEEYFSCGRFILLVGSWEPSVDDVNRVLRAELESLRIPDLKWDQSRFGVDAIDSFKQGRS